MTAADSQGTAPISPTLYAYIPGKAGTVMQYVRLDYIPVVSHSVVIDHATVFFFLEN